MRIHASHGFAVSKLRELLAREPGLRVDIRYVGNPSSLVSLAHGGCDLAGMHLPQGALRRQAVTTCRDLLSQSAHRIVGFVTREMGLMVKRVLAVMRGPDFHKAVSSLPGYRANHMGEIRTVREVLRNPAQ